MGRIFDRHHDRVFRHVLRWSASTDDAQDVAAMTFLEAWRLRRRARFVDGSILPWLLVVAMNVARNATRSQRRYEAAVRRVPAEPTYQDGAERVDDRLDARRVMPAFENLDRRHQDVLALCVIEELTVAEAARALGIPPGTVKSRLSRAKQHLATALVKGESA
jgi:RNA polymerase sigma-70 factor (ECF subfamily)